VTGRYARTIVAAGVVLAGLLVVVAVASRSELGDGGGSVVHRPGLPGGLFAYVYAGLLVCGLLALPFFFYVYARETPYSKSGRRKARLAPLWLVGFAALGMFVATRWGDELRGALENLRFWDAGPPDPNPENAVRPLAPAWFPLVVVSSALVGGVGSVFAWRAARRRLRRPSLAASLTDALDDTLDDVADEPDPRRAIILAYARMEAALDRCGCTRHEAEAPLEYLARVLGELDVPPAPVATLTELFEHAKFSHHDIGPEQKARALGALVEIRSLLAEQR
jgi:Domain of unknown function (DUF4129)